MLAAARVELEKSGFVPEVRVSPGGSEALLHIAVHRGGN